MTWSAKFTVQDVGDGPAPIDVMAVAQREDINSNTEGEIIGIEMRIQLGTDSTSLKEGDTFTASGHFQG